MDILYKIYLREKCQEIFLARKKAPIEILINQLVNSFFSKFYLNLLLKERE
jgi:hypothetical protein